MNETDLVRVIERNLDHATFCNRIAVQAQSLIDGANGAAVLVLGDGGLEAISASGLGHQYVGTSLGPHDSLAGQSLAARRLLWSDDVRCDPRVHPRLRANPRARSLAAVPLLDRVDDHLDPVGVLTLTAPHAGAFDARARATLARIADFVATTLSAIGHVEGAASALVDHLDDPVTVARSDGRAERCTADAEQIGDFVANVLRPGSASVLKARARVEEVIAQGRVEAMVQPIVELVSGRAIGVEALVRFPDDPGRPVEEWFAEAERSGCGFELEALALDRACALLDQLPAGLLLTVNVGHDLLVSDLLVDRLRGLPGRRIVLELTEHAAFADYGPVRRAVDALRRAGVRLAIDDLGSGFSSFRHLIELEPEWIKLDRVFMDGIEHDHARRSLAVALAGYAATTGTRLVAEGVETPAQLAIVRNAGVHFAQGFLLARPGSVDALGELELRGLELPAVTTPRRAGSADRRRSIARAEALLASPMILPSAPFA